MNPQRRPPGDLAVLLQHANVVIVHAGYWPRIGPGRGETLALWAKSIDHFAVAEDVDLGQVVRADDAYVQPWDRPCLELVAHDEGPGADIQDDIVCRPIDVALLDGL